MRYFFFAGVPYATSGLCLFFLPGATLQQHKLKKTKRLVCLGMSLQGILDSREDQASAHVWVLGLLLVWYPRQHLLLNIFFNGTRKNVPSLQYRHTCPAFCYFSERASSTTDSGTEAFLLFFCYFNMLEIKYKNSESQVSLAGQFQKVSWQKIPFVFQREYVLKSKRLGFVLFRLKFTKIPSWINSVTFKCVLYTPIDLTYLPNTTSNKAVASFD